MSEREKINITLKVWRQAGLEERGRFETIPAEDVDPNMSFLEMLDGLNEKLILEDKEPIEFDNDCREGICGTCGAMVNGIPHGYGKGMTICQLHMRRFKDGDTLYIDMVFTATIGRREISWPNIDRFRFENGLAVERRAFFDPLALLPSFLASPTGWRQLWALARSDRGDAARNRETFLFF